MKKILIVGAGGFGREVLSWLKDWIRAREGWTVDGFLDDHSGALDCFTGLPSIRGPISSYQPQADEFLVCALGNPRVKLNVCNQLSQRGAEFLTLVHPTAVVGERVRIGRGTVICPLAVVTCDIELGEFVTLNAAATVGHDVVIGDGVTLSGHCDITGGVKVGKGAFFGSHASVIPGMTIGEFAVVGAGSTVVRNVKPGVTVFGIPAKQILETSL